MANDQEINVQVKAGVDGIKASMAEAAESVTQFSEQAVSHLETVGAAFEGLNKLMLGFVGILAGGAIFKEVIEDTEKWNTSVIQLGATLGIGVDEASGLATTLGTLGVSTETYQSAALKLDRQVRTNSDSLEELGLKVRDANGQVKNQQDLMLEAVALLNTYEAGTNRNVAAQILFGRGAGDLTTLLRLNSDALIQGADNAEKFGLVLDEEGKEAAIEFGQAVNKAHLEVDGIQRVLAEAVIPLLESFADSATKTNIPLQTMVVIVAALETAFYAVGVVVKELMDGIVLFAVESVQALQTLAEVAQKTATLDFSGAKSAWQQGWSDIKDIGKASGDQMVSDAQAYQKKFDQIWGFAPKGNENKGSAPPPGTKQVPTDLFKTPDNGKEEDKLRELAVAQNKLIADDAIKSKQDENKNLLDLDQETNAQFLQNKLSLQQQLDAIDIQAAQDKVDSIQNDEVAYQKAQNDLVAIRLRTAEQEKQIQNEIALDAEKDYLDLSRSINSSFESTFVSFADGTKSMSQAFSDFAKSVIDDLLKIEAKNLLGSVFGPLTGAGQNGGSLGGIIASGVSGISSGSGGGILSSLGSLLPSFDVGAYNLPSDTMANVHKGEMIIPAGQASQIRAGGSGSSGDVNTSVVVNVSSGGQPSGSVSGDSAMGKQIGALISQAVSQEIVKQQRPGGLLNG